MISQTSAEPEERGNPLDAVVGEFHDARGRIACPYSLQVADLLTSFSFKSKSCNGFVTQKELDENGGVCKKCAAKIKKRGVAHGDRKEIPVEINPSHHHSAAVCDFNYDGLDELIDGVSTIPKNKQQNLFDALEKIMRWCFSSGHTSQAAVRLAVIGDNLYPELIGAKSNKELAKQLGVSRQVFSLARANFKEHFGIKLAELKPPNNRKQGQDGG